MYPHRSLETFRSNLNLFHVTFNRNLKQAKNTYNVIDDIFSNNPLYHVCIPGLHVTLGIYIKLLNEFESFCKDIDLQIAHILALNIEEAENTHLNTFVEKGKGIGCVERNITELDERGSLVIKS